MGKLRLLLAIFLGFTGVLQAADRFDQRLAEARTQYFAYLQGSRSAADKARASFTALSHDYPGNSVVDAYSGSLELLEAAHTWAIWDKRRLANEGLAKMDQAVNRAPDDLEARFIRAASAWHLPFFYKRREQAATISPSLLRGLKPLSLRELSPSVSCGSARLLWQVLIDRSDSHGAKQAFEAAVRVDGNSPGRPRCLEAAARGIIKTFPGKRPLKLQIPRLRSG